MGGLTSRCGKRLDTPERAAGATRPLAGRVARVRARAQPPWLSEPPRAFGDRGGGMSRTLSAARRQPAGPRRRADGLTPPFANEIPSGGRVSKRHIRRSWKSGGATLPRRVPSTRSRCRRNHWRFVPRSGCRAKAAPTRRGYRQIGSRRPISGAQLPRPPLVYLVRPRSVQRRNETTCNSKPL